MTSLILFPLLLLGVFALAVAYRIHAENSEAGHSWLPPYQSPKSTTSILIFSPHPDDETLGAGGLIQQTVRAGGIAHVVFMTNGDAFRVGVASYYKIFQVQPSDYIRYGEMRQKEALKALSTLGLSSANVVFLGYADRGLMGMWETNWIPSNPWTSSYSHASNNPYPNAPSYGQPYCGQNVLLDVEKQIIADHPTDIYVTHPTDDHPDHSAASSFILAAIKQLEADGDSWLYDVNLHYFIIHRGDWPVPQGNYPTLTIGPPAAFARLDTQWHSLSLTTHETATKQLALNHYVSQEEMMDRLLVSFIRTNEIFGELPDVTSTAKNIGRDDDKLTADAQTWPVINPVAKDPVGDTELRVFQPGGDIKEIYAAYDQQDLYLKVVMRARLSRTINYKVCVRPFNLQMDTVPNVLTYSFSPRYLSENRSISLSSGAVVSWRGATSEYVIPLSSLGGSSLKMIFAQATTTFSQVTIDHTGYRPIYLTPKSETAPLS